MIELRNVTKEYSKGNAALNGVSVKIERGEIRFHCRRQRLGKIHADPPDHEGTQSYGWDHHCKRTEPQPNETS